jgi:cytochrome c553
MILTLVAAALVAGPVAAQDKAKGAAPPKSLADNLKLCASCHGEDGNKPLTPEFPKLGGQHYDYLLHSLKSYKAGVRKNPIMMPLAQALSTKEMEELAAYYSRQHSTLHVIPLHRLAHDER